MTAIQLSAEIANQLKVINGNTDLMKKALDYLKSLSAQIKPSQKADEHERTKKFIESFAGKWQDERSEDKMVADIYAARKNHDSSDLIKILDE